MFNFLKKDPELNPMDSVFLETLESLEITSRMLQLELLKNETKWNDEKIQTFLPLILNYTNFDWLEITAKNECNNADYIIVKNFLDKVQLLMRNGEVTLQKEVETYDL